MFPRWLKIQKPIPQHLKWEKNNPENYRTLSLLISMSKNFEKVCVFESHCEILSQKNILNPRQFGFRSTMSFFDAIAKIMDFLRTEIDHEEMGCAFLLI